MEIDTIIIISLVLSYLILMTFEIKNRKKTRDLYRRFKQKNIQAFEEENYYSEILKEYNNRTSSSGWLRWKLLSEKNRLEYYTYVHLGYIMGFSLFFIRFGDIGLLILPLSSFILLALIIVKRRKFKIIKAIADYFTLGLMMMALIMLIITSMLFFIEEINQPIFNISSDQIGWFLAISQICFTFAVGLFLVVTLPAMANKFRMGMDSHLIIINEEIKINEIKGLSELFKTKVFKESYETYGRASSILRYAGIIILLMLSFIIIGALIMAQIISESSVDDGLITPNDLLSVLIMLIFFTVVIIISIYSSNLEIKKS